MELMYQYAQFSPKQLAEEIIDGFHSSHGVDLRSIFNDASLNTGQKARRARVVLLEALLNEADRSGLHAEFASPTDFDEDALLAQLLDETVEIEPNVAFTQSDADFVMAQTGQDIHTYLFTLTKRMENMAKSKTAGQLAIEMVAGGLVSVGVPMAIGTIKALRAGMTVLNAVRAGITSIGLKTSIGAVVVVLVAFLLYLFLENPKKILGMVINDTDDHLIVKDWRKGVDGGTDSDLFMQHGHMVNFMQDNEEGLQSPQVQIRARAFFAEKDPDNVIFGGVYYADRNFGLRGAEGVMIFTAKNSSLRFAHMFAVPYFNDNGTNMRLLSGETGSIEQLYREMYDSRKVQLEFNDGGYHFRSGVDNARGGVVGCIGSIRKIAG